MFILVSHSISQPAQFWGSVQKYLTTLPEGGVKKVIIILPSENMDQCTSVWEADSIESLNSYLENKIGNTSKYNYYQINEANALGLKELKIPEF